MEEMEPIELLRHVRHDWLNHIQLIKGYLSMGKPERVNEIIDNVVKQTQNESMLSNLGLPKLAYFILTYNWHSSKIILKFEVAGKRTSNSIDDFKFTNWLKGLLHIIEESSSSNSENIVFIKFETNKDDLSFNLEYRGILTNKETILDYLNENAPFHNNPELLIQDDIIQINLQWPEEIGK